MAETVASQAEQDYLKAIYHLAKRAEGGRVTTTMLAERLGISAASVTNMVKKLSERGFAAHSPYHGVTLTSAGERAALEVLRHHRLLETYLSTRLGVPWDSLHAEADRLEHALSEDLEARIAADLGEPTTDPHGAPIPAKDGTIAAPPTARLTGAMPGSVVTVAEVEDEDGELLRYLADLGLVPGARVDVLTKGPFGGPLHVRVGGREYALGDAVTEAVSILAGGDTTRDTRETTATGMTEE